MRDISSSMETLVLPTPAQLPAHLLSWKGTFIEACTSSELSPRASSDPGSVSSSYSSHFAAEHAYMSTLASRIAKSFTQSEDLSPSFPSEVCSEPGRNHEGSLQKHSNRHSTIVSDSSASSSFRENVLLEQVQSNQELQLNREKLKVRIRTNAETHQRFSNALSSIREIPEQVNEVLQQAATDLVDGVSNEVTKACQLLVDRVCDQETSTKVATQVQDIPDLVVASFEVSFAKAMGHVRVRVEDMIQTLERSDMETDEVVQHLWCIPEEVQQITCEAVKEASVTSQDRVVEQLDYVMQTISEEKQIDCLFQAKQIIVDSLPQTLPETVRRSCEVAKHSIQGVSLLVAKKGINDCGYVENGVVADTLLRAKVGNSLQVEELANPGSKGHPEFCSRACLYFPKGQCKSGSNCAYCHAPHPKRPIHLDKRHREMIRGMDFKDIFNLILPILESKLVDLDECDEATKDSVATIAETFERHKVDKKSNKAYRTLQSSLKFMSVRSLFALLFRARVPIGDPYNQSIKQFFNVVHPSLSDGDQVPLLWNSSASDDFSLE